MKPRNEENNTRNKQAEQVVHSSPVKATVRVTDKIERLCEQCSSHRDSTDRRAVFGLYVSTSVILSVSVDEEAPAWSVTHWGLKLASGGRDLLGDG